MTLNTKKYKETILYLCSHLNNEVRGKKKLAKLLYFADFDLFEKLEKSLTGDIYKAFPMGPFPEAMERITVEMVNDGTLVIETKEEYQGYIQTEMYKGLKETDITVFDLEEKKILARVIIKYGHLNGKQLEDLTHAEAPYVGTEAFKEIPYELAYYRGTDFSDD